MAMTWATVVLEYAPELSDISDDVGTAKVRDAKLQISEDAWGDLYDCAVANLAAHLAATGPGGVDRGGPVTAESAGGLSRSYGNYTSKRPNSRQATRWGREFESMIDRLSHTPFIA